MATKEFLFAGFGGQKFIPESLERARTVREKLDSLGRRDVPIEMDGGIGPANAAEVIRAGVQMLVAGSAVFKSENPQETIKALRNA